MKRNPALQPLSREHHTALTLSKACARAVEARDDARVEETCQRVVQAFAAELEPHFQIEEQSLLPLLHGAKHQALVQHTLADHRELRALLEGVRRNDSHALGSFGRRLADHVRFEERALFPALEDMMPR